MIRRLRQELELRRLVARDPRAHDIYIVEFPKSGITWLCTLIANMALREAGSPQQVTHYNVQQYIPDIHMAQGTAIGDSILTAIPQRLIKSHSFSNRFYQSVIYLARHPAAVMRSYCTYLNQQPGNDFTLEHLLNNEKYGLPAWQRHVRGWLQRDNRARRLHLVRYEDLLDDAGATLQQINANLGWKISGDSIRQAVDLSGAGVMKHSEETYREHHPGYSMTFVKNRQPGMAEGLVERIEELCAEELELLGYRR